MIFPRPMTILVAVLVATGAVVSHMDLRSAEVTAAIVADNDSARAPSSFAEDCRRAGLQYVAARQDSGVWTYICVDAWLRPREVMAVARAR